MNCENLCVKLRPFPAVVIDLKGGPLNFLLDFALFANYRDWAKFLISHGGEGFNRLSKQSKCFP